MAQKAHVPEAKMQDANWECPNCTFSNLAVALKCNVCSTAKPPKPNFNNASPRSDSSDWDEWEVVSIDKQKSQPEIVSEKIKVVEPEPEPQDEEEDVDVDAAHPPRNAQFHNHGKRAKVEQEADEKVQEEDKAENPHESGEQDDNDEKEEHVEELGCFWKCSTCNVVNEERFRYCPGCGLANKSLQKDVGEGENDEKDKKVRKDAEAEKVAENRVIKDAQDEKMDSWDVSKVKLELKGVLHTGAYKPGEKRNTGWVLRNESNVDEVRLEAELFFVGGDKDIMVKPLDMYEIALKPKEEMYVLVDLMAPGYPGEFNTFYQLRVKNSKKPVGPFLNLEVKVSAVHSTKKEKKIESIVKMGFTERKRIEQALCKHNWDVNKAVQELLES